MTAEQLMGLAIDRRKTKHMKVYKGNAKMLKIGGQE
jgi:hypothetical protein